MSSESQQAMTNACNKRHREFYAARKNSENEHCLSWSTNNGCKRSSAIGHLDYRSQKDRNFYTWSGLMSQNKYYYGFFTAAMKVPTGFTSGVVVAFYLSNADVFPHNHDEIDSELPGHERIELWVLQTNICGNGSVRIGRGEILTMVRPNNRFSRM